jgi:NAD-dependent deacetylase
MREIHNIVILTGAGISAESGLATFRGPEGLWEGHRVESRRTVGSVALASIDGSIPNRI